MLARAIEPHVGALLSGSTLQRVSAFRKHVRALEILSEEVHLQLSTPPGMHANTHTHIYTWARCLMSVFRKHVRALEILNEEMLVQLSTPPGILIEKSCCCVQTRTNIHHLSNGATGLKATAI